MEIDQLASLLNENIEIVGASFKSLGLKVAKANVINISDSGEIEIGIEVEGATEDGVLPQDTTIKVVAYDEKDNIIGIESSNLYESSFNGFDVLWIYFNTEGVAFRMRKLKIFAQER